MTVYGATERFPLNRFGHFAKNSLLPRLIEASNLWALQLKTDPWTGSYVGWPKRASGKFFNYTVTTASMLVSTNSMIPSPSIDCSYIIWVSKSEQSILWFSRNPRYSKQFHWVRAAKIVCQYWLSAIRFSKKYLQSKYFHLKKLTKQWGILFLKTKSRQELTSNFEQSEYTCMIERF